MQMHACNGNSTAAFKSHADYSSRQHPNLMIYNADTRQDIVGIDFGSACEKVSVREYDRTELPFACVIYE